jgi:hypothetical protein
MPHSLRARLSGLRYKKIISDKDYVRLCKALDNEKILDNIKAEIEAYQSDAFYPDDVMMNRRMVLEIINKYRGEEDETDN